MIITADPHETDQPNDEYRWAIFDELHEFARATNDKHIVILGDLTDRKDRHSAALVNRLIEYLVDLTSDGTEVDILKGNHDTPINPAATPYWSFLSTFPRIRFHTRPAYKDGVFYLPYESAPATAWHGLDFDHCHVVLMHQTVYRAKAMNGKELKVRIYLISRAIYESTPAMYTYHN